MYTNRYHFLFMREVDNQIDHLFLFIIIVSVLPP